MKVSMNQIAIEAGIGSGTLYRRYRNKSELCLDLKKDNFKQLFESFEEYLIQHRADPPCQRLKEILRLFIRFRENNAQLLTGIESGAIENRSSAIMQTPVYNKMFGIDKSLQEFRASFVIIKSLFRISMYLGLE